MSEPLKYPFHDLRLAHASMIDELKAAICEVVESGRFLHGEQTEALEREVAQVCQTKYCVAVSNGLDALRLTLRAWVTMGLLDKGDEVLVPANTYIASVLAISDAGLVPVPVPPSEQTMNLDATACLPMCSERTRAVMPVHLYGTPCWDESLAALVAERHLLVLEDNAQAIGARAALPGLHGTRATGSIGHAGALSFYPTKNVGALGDAGAVTTNDADLAAMVRTLANYGEQGRYHNTFKGYNCRMDEVQAAALRVKLRYLDSDTRRRNAVAQAYRSGINSPYVTVPQHFSGMVQVWHQYVVRTPYRDAFRQHLLQCGVGTNIHYPTAVHRQPCYADLHCNEALLAVADHLAEQVVSLPVAPPLTPDDASEIAQIINTFKP